MTLKKSELSNNDKYGIVIDSGSSGSRIQIYKWKDPKLQQDSPDSTILQSPPKITQEKGWTRKTTPGISKYNTQLKIKEIWSRHYSDLMTFAEGIIPADKHKETPVFVLSTAGMRLLPEKTQKKILKETCRSIRENTNFYLPDCKNFVQIIDGSTEGIYGWLGLNYLMGQFDNYDVGKSIHESIGFMDMGGASTQIAFVPSSKEQIAKHSDDLAKVTLRNINGQTQSWDVFVATWLGFGANEARKRFLNQLIESINVNVQVSNEVNDPCLQRGATMNYSYEGKNYVIKGVGNYEVCVKTIYPLLMKSIPCEDEPCLFNGIHGPQLNFEKDKFIGISEYWYTANDIFQSGGEYNFKAFNKKVKEYCESNWDVILENGKAGKYLNLDPDKFLKDACFKASWVMNILHEGFELPRLGIDIKNSERSTDVLDITKAHVPFKSANSIGGEELSWTLGKILLFASSQIPPVSNNDKLEIGIYPSEISHKEFVPGGVSLSSKSYDSDDDDDNGVGFGQFMYSLLFIFLLLFFIYRFGKSHFGKWSYKLRRIQIPIQFRKPAEYVANRIPGIRRYVDSFIYSNLDQANMTLEEGLMELEIQPQMSKQAPGTIQDASVLRTRLTISLNEQVAPHLDTQNSSVPSPSSKFANPRMNNFMNKPFVVPKKNGQGSYQSEADSRESLPRGNNIPRSKSSID